MKTNTFDKYKIEYTPGKMVREEIRVELSKFYSQHYGIWSKVSLKSPNPGGRIRISEKSIGNWLDNEDSELWMARDKLELIGYAIALKGKSGSNKPVIWVTQFVVHEKYRNHGVGKRLLFAIWGLSSFFAWGLVTANPYAVRALEKATRRRCEPVRIKKNMKQLLNYGIKNVSYIDETTEKVITNLESKINTEFYLDHSELNEMLEKATTLEKPWKMGKIEVGWEWFAFTFNDQSQIDLSPKEIEEMLEASDAIAQEAYGRMQMDDGSQKWSKYTTEEVNFIINAAKIKKGDRILDVGCGTGRHCIELSKRGYDTTGIDYAEPLIDSARKKANNLKLGAQFICGDMTEDNTTILNSPYDCIICIYDVIGSYADNKKNFKILENISNAVKPGGIVIISVMNLHLTEHQAKNKFRLKESSKELLKLKASDTMETTGNIFNPEFYLIDEDTKVIYRKETFSHRRDRFPTELIVRDRRFYLEEISEMCKEAGLEIIESRFVNAGWKNSYDIKNSKAKEILLVCQKNSSHSVLKSIFNIFSLKKR